MKRVLIALALVIALTCPTKPADAAPLMRNVITSCAAGAGILAITTHYGLTSALATGAIPLPVTEVLAANALIGCGIGVAGAVSSTVVGWVYDAIF